jgi:hypothetical protein
MGQTHHRKQTTVTDLVDFVTLDFHRLHLEIPFGIPVTDRHFAIFRLVEFESIRLFALVEDGTVDRRGHIGTVIDAAAVKISLCLYDLAILHENFQVPCGSADDEDEGGGDRSDFHVSITKVSFYLFRLEEELTSRVVNGGYGKL